MKVKEDVKEHLGIIIDYSRDNNLPEQGLVMLTAKGFYKTEKETSPQETFARAAVCYSFGDYDFAQRIYDYVSQGYFMYASPVQTNAVEIDWPTFTEEQFEEAGDWLEENVEPNGMPISCFLSYIDDSKSGLTKTSAEAKELSMMGGGVGIYAGNRSPDEKSTGVMAHAGDYDNMTIAYRQTASRRGSMAMYLDINHPELAMFMDMRNPTRGDENKKCFNLNHGLNIPDEFMFAVIADEELEFVDPKHGPTGRKVKARDVWKHLMETRFETGEPYILFIDTVNRNLPKQITKPTYKVRQSNLCSEITLMTSFSRTAVCCLSSLNLEKFDEWKDTNIVADLIRFLDNVLEYFIRLAPPSISRAVNSATKERALGLGTLGWHSYLQSKMIPFESGGFNSAVSHTQMIHSYIKERAEKESLRLGALRGEASDCRGSGFRNSHLTAIAPNASSASILGASPSREPWASNGFVSQGRAGSFLIKNKYLKPVLQKYGIDNEETWARIVKEEGSVQWIEQLSDHEKAVFATAREIDPMWIVELASNAQQHVCQSISTNLFFQATTTAQQISDVHIYAWEKGLKSLYYCRAQEPVKADVGTGKDRPLNAVKVKKRIEYDKDACLSCQG